MLKIKYKIWLLLLLLLAVFLRIYKIFSNFYFSGELGKEMLFIAAYSESLRLPLAGMATSHEWLSYGPLYYWLMIPIYLFFSKSPLILFWVALAVSVGGLFLNYVVLKKIKDEQIALIATALQAISPLLIWQTRLSKLHVFYWLISPVLMLFTYYLWKGRKKYLFWTGLLYGILFSFHFSQIPIFAVFVILFIVKRRNLKLNDAVKFLAGMVLPNVTYLWFNLKLFLWLPYRILNTGTKNPSETAGALTEFFGKMFFWNKNLELVGLILFGIIFGTYLYKNRKNFKNDFLAFYLSISIGIMLLANIVHGSPPLHYFLPIFTLVPILIAVVLPRLKFWFFAVPALLLINIAPFLNEPLFYKDFKGKIPGSDIVSYETIKNIAETTVQDAGGKKISVRRIGPYDYFAENYSQNYKYMIKYFGGNIDNSSDNVYLITEGEYEVNVKKQN